MAKKKKSTAAIAEKERLKREQIQQENQVFNRMLVAFCVAVVIEVILVILYRSYYSGREYVREMLIALLTMLGITGLSILTSVAGIITRRPRLAKTAAAAGAFSLALSAQVYLIVRYGLTALKGGCVVFPVVLVLYIIYVIYQREFFVTALLGAGGVGAAWLSKLMLYRRVPEYKAVLYVFAAIVVVFAIITLVSMLKKGKLNIGKKSVELFGDKANYLLLFITYGVSLVIGFFYWQFEPDSFSWVVLSYGVYTFLAAIYYTVKLM